MYVDETSIIRSWCIPGSAHINVCMHPLTDACIIGFKVGLLHCPLCSPHFYRRILRSGSAQTLSSCMGCDPLAYIHTYIHTYIHAYIHTYIQYTIRRNKPSCESEAINVETSPAYIHHFLNACGHEAFTTQSFHYYACMYVGYFLVSLCMYVCMYILFSTKVKQI